MIVVIISIIISYYYLCVQVALMIVDLRVNYLNPNANVIIIWSGIYVHWMVARGVSPSFQPAGLQFTNKVHVMQSTHYHAASAAAAFKIEKKKPEQWKKQWQSKVEKKERSKSGNSTANLKICSVNLTKKKSDRHEGTGAHILHVY